jgi:hypothetical protein
MAHLRDVQRRFKNGFREGKTKKQSMIIQGNQLINKYID